MAGLASQRSIRDQGIEDGMMQLIALMVANILGLLTVACLSKLLFGDFYPYPRASIMDEHQWARTLVRFLDKTRSEVMFTTYAFSSFDFHKSIEEALARAIRRNAKVRIIGAQGLMPDQRRKNLQNLGCDVTLVPKAMLDEKDRFYNHLLVSDGMHWLWLNPHPPEEKHVHFGTFEMYDYDRAVRYRSELVALLGRHLERASEAEK